MNNFNSSLEEKMKIDEVIAEMKKHPIDYSDIPPMTAEQRKTGRLHYKAFLDMLPPDIVAEMARRRLAQLDASGYALPGTFEVSARQAVQTA